MRRAGYLLWLCVSVPLGILAMLGAASMLLIGWFCAICAECLFSKRR